MLKRLRLILMSVVLFGLITGCTVLVNDDVRIWVLQKTSYSGYQQLINTVAETSVGGFTLDQLVRSLFIIAITFLLRKTVFVLVFQFLRKITNRDSLRQLHKGLMFVQKPLAWFVTVTGIFLALEALPWDSGGGAIIVKLYKGISVVLAIWACIRLMDVFLETLARKSKKDSSLQGLLPLISRCSKIFVFIMGLIMVLENLGYSAGSVVAAFGIGSAAIAFASKDTIANFFGSLSIALDHPFKVGDRIRLRDGGVDGVVESLGIRSTRIRTLSKSFLTIPNRVLADESIDNWTLLQKRKVKQFIGIVYGTPVEAIAQIVEDIKALLDQDDFISPGDSVVSFENFGSSSLDICVHYFTKTINWVEYLAIKQRINLEIIKIVEKNGSSMAFPTQTLHIEK